MPEYFKQSIGELDCVLVADKKMIETEPPKAVVIFCHGFGAPGTDLVPLAQAIADGQSGFDDVLFIFPAAPLELDPTFDARAWWPIDIEKIQQLQATGQFREMADSVPERLEPCRKMIFEIIDSCRKPFSLPANQIVVGGFSQGAMLATDVALNYPETLGGLVLWSGNLINQTAWAKAAATKSDLKIFQSHGRTDPILPFAGAELLRDLLSVTGNEVDFVEFPGQHAIPPEAIDGAGRLIASLQGIAT